MTGPAIDVAALRRLDEDSGLAADVVRLFLENLDVRRAAVLDAAAASLAGPAHALRSPSGLVGAGRLEECCATVEALTLAGLPVPRGLLDELDEECSRVRGELAAWLAGRAARRT